MTPSNHNNANFSCTECTLQHGCIPNYIDPSQLNIFEIILKRSRILHKGDYLHREGDPVNFLYIIRSGVIKEYTNNKVGDEQIINFFLPGEIVALDSMNQKNFRCSATALETTTFCAIPIDKFEHLCNKIPGLQRVMLNIMSKVISFEEKMMLTACNKKADERVATFLMSLSKRFQHLGYSPTEIHLPMSRHEIGCYLGLTNETVSRVITQLQKDDIISVQSKMILVKDIDTLKDISQQCHIHKITEHHIPELLKK